MKEVTVTVRVTKKLEKDIDDLDKCVAHCDDARQKKTLGRISANLKKLLRLPASSQSGGTAPIDPAVYNTEDLLANGNSSSSSIDAGGAGSALLNVPAPFYENGLMGAGSLFSAGTQPFYLPGSSPVVGGGKKRVKTRKTKKH